jgi:protein phosphatase
LGTPLRIVLLSDIHGNYDALSTVLNLIKDYDYLVVVGDLVDYGPEPEKVVDTIKSLNAIVVRGNHDHAVAFNVDCGCGEKTHDISIFTRERITIPRLDENQVKYLGSLPLEETISLNGYSLKIVHGSPSNPLYGYVYPWNIRSSLCSTNLRLAASMDEKECELTWSVLFLGHTHYQFSLRMGKTLIVNPGSVGQPRDGDQRASFTIVELNGDEQKIIHYKAKYDVDSTLRKLSELIQDKYYYDKLARILINGKIT